VTDSIECGKCMLPLYIRFYPFRQAPMAQAQRPIARLSDLKLDWPTGVKIEFKSIER
jgi:hypothetical protein